MSNGDFKAYFEANLLDGDNVHTESKGTMLNAQDTYIVLAEYINKLQQEVMDCLPEEIIEIGLHGIEGREGWESTEVAYIMANNQAISQMKTNLKVLFDKEK